MWRHKSNVNHRGHKIWNTTNRLHMTHTRADGMDVEDVEYITCVKTFADEMQDYGESGGSRNAHPHTH